MTHKRWYEVQILNRYNMWQCYHVTKSPKVAKDHFKKLAFDHGYGVANTRILRWDIDTDTTPPTIIHHTDIDKEKETYN